MYGTIDAKVEKCDAYPKDINIFVGNHCFTHKFDSQEERDLVFNELEARMSNRICIKWHVHDVISIGRNLGLHVKESDARHILEQVKHGHDSSVGINWDTIEHYVRQFYSTT